MFTRSAITLAEGNGLDEIWGTLSILFAAGPDRFWARSALKRERETLQKFFLSGKQRKTLPISGQPIFMKFAHKTCFCDSVNLFGNIFWKFALRGSFCPKNLDHPQWFLTLGSDFSEMITNVGTWWQVGVPVECCLSIRTVGINSKSFAWPAGSAQERTFQCAVLLWFTYLKRRVTMHQTNGKEI